MTSDQHAHANPQQVYDNLSNEIADILLGPDSPVRGNPEFDESISEHDRLTKRQAELKTLDTKLVEVLPGLEQAESQLTEAAKHLAAEKKKLAGFAGELGEAAFAGLRAGELPDHPLFNDRKELQSRVESLQRQKAELVAGENAGMMEKTKVQAQQLKLTGQIKVEELKIGSLDRALGTALLKSKEKPSVQCGQTDEVLKAIADQRKLVVTAREQVKQAEASMAGKCSAAAEPLGRSTVNDADSLKSELKEVRKEHRQNEKAIISGRSSVVTTALEIESLRGDTALGEKLKQLWSLNFDLDANKSQGMKMVDGCVSKFLGLPSKFKNVAVGVAGAVVLLAGLYFLMNPAGPSEEIAGSLASAVQEAEAMSAQSDANIKQIHEELAFIEKEHKETELLLQQGQLERKEIEKLQRAQNALKLKQEELERKEEQAKREQLRLQRELDAERNQTILAAKKQTKAKGDRIEAEKVRKTQMALRRDELERVFSSINLDPMIKVSKSVTSIAEVKSTEIRGPNYLKYQSLYKQKDWLGLFNLHTGESWTDDSLPSAVEIRSQGLRLRSMRLSVFFETNLQPTAQKQLYLVSEGYFSFPRGSRPPVVASSYFKRHPDGHGWVHNWTPKDGRAVLYYSSGKELTLKLRSAQSQLQSTMDALSDKIKLGEKTRDEAVNESRKLYDRLQDSVFNWVMVN
jgi:hypothetical protein